MQFLGPKLGLGFSDDATIEALVAGGEAEARGVRIGDRVAEVGGRTMKRLLLELGGKGAGLVLDDADVTNAVGMIGSTRTLHSTALVAPSSRVMSSASPTFF